MKIKSLSGNTPLQLLAEKTDGIALRRREAFCKGARYRNGAGTPSGRTGAYYPELLPHVVFCNEAI